MRFLSSLLAFSAAALAAPSGSANLLPSQSCCFSLADSSTSSPVQQSSSGGWLYLNHGSYPTKTYCIDSMSQLRDPSNSACFLNPNGQAKCLDVSPWGGEWKIEAKRLVVNGKKKFLACKGIGGEAIWQFGKTGCREFEIEPVNLKGSC